MSEQQPPEPSPGYRSPFLSPDTGAGWNPPPPSGARPLPGGELLPAPQASPPPPAGYPQQPPYTPNPPTPAAVKPPPIFDPDALFRPPAPPPTPPGYPTGGGSDRPGAGLIAGVVAVVLLLLGVGVWAIGQQGKKPPKAAPLVGSASAGPVTQPFQALPPAPPTPVGFTHQHISGMEFDVPGDCINGDGTDLGSLSEGLPPKISILYACMSEDGNRMVVVSSYDIGADTISDLTSQSSVAMYTHNLGLRGGNPQVTAHQVLGRPGLIGVVTCGCTHPVAETDALGLGADGQYYEIIAAQLGTPHPDAAAIIDSARPTR